MLIAIALLLASAGSDNLYASTKPKCLAPVAEYERPNLTVRSVPMGKGRYFAKYEWRGGEYVYYCTKGDRAIFSRLPKDQRRQIVEQILTADRKILEGN